MNTLAIAQRVLSKEAYALKLLEAQLPKDFSAVIEFILKITGRVIVIGIGKSGYIANKFASSLTSTGTSALYLHPSEASHGELGIINKSDVLFVLSKSGETKELMDTVKYCNKLSIKVILMTMNPTSNLARNSDFLLTIPLVQEASLLSAPTTSALMMLALGDSITVSLHEAKGFTKENFLLFHPGGKIGNNSIKIRDLMFIGDDLPIIKPDDSFYRIILAITEKSLGCALVVEKNLVLVGIITSANLRRNIDRDLSIVKALDIMTKSFKSVQQNISLSEALFIMNKESIIALPVTEEGKIIGIIHKNDIIRAGIT